MTFDLRLVTDLTIICKGTNSKKSFFTVYYQLRAS